MKFQYQIGRTRFAKEIVCEFVKPKRKSNKAIILCVGAPTYAGKRDKVMEFFAERGYWAFVPRYRGTWESDGAFLKKSPHEDVIDVMNGIEKGFENLLSGEKHKILKPRFFLLGGSFGGPAAILAARDKRVVKSIALSPVVDWTQQDGTAEPLDFLDQYVPNAFGNGYRGRKNVWSRLAKNDFYSPTHEKESVPGEKLLIIHAKDDFSVPFNAAKKFAYETKAQFIGVRVGGHMSFKALTHARFRGRMESFLRLRK
jgi:dipeptidyl aminopeptidase/acylaminoacyl peptidase